MKTKPMITVIMSLCILLLPQVTGAAPVPDTGQTACFTNTSNEIITCPAPGEAFYGQDGNYSINTQSYTKLDENRQPLPDSAVSWTMVRDNMTGLIWESKDIRNGSPNYTNPHDPDNIYYWYDGVSGTPGNGTTTFDTQYFINQLNAQQYGGYDDWRLPKANELGFIRWHDPVVAGSWCNIDTDYFPNTKLPEYNAHYWTSSVSWHNTNQRIVVNFSFGQVVYDWTGTGRYVRAVRGGTFTNDFYDNGDGTISDGSTGLMWLKDGFCLGLRSWQSALATVYNLNLSPGSYACDEYTATYDDWRLPTTNELLSIVDYSTHSPSIDTDYFPETGNNSFWTSTTNNYPGSSHNFNDAQKIGFQYGWVDDYGKGGGLYLRPVRGGTFLQFDVNGDDKTEGPVELLFCEGESKEIAIWLTGWDAAYRGNVESVDYYFTWDPAYLDVIVTPVPDDAWDTSTETKTPGQYHLQLSSTGGVPGQAMKLHTVTLKCTSSPAIAWMRVDITAGGIGNVTPVGGSAYYYVNPSEATINTICTGSPLTCTEQDHCETLDGDDICPPTATQTDEGYTWEPQETTPLCEGDNVIVSRTRKGYHTVIEDSTPTVCDSACFRECYDNCGYMESQGCYLRCIKGCANGVCPNWADPEVCYEYQSRIGCNVSCYFQCKNTYDDQTQTSYYDKQCGFFINEPVTVRDSNGSCTGTERGGPYTLRGAGTASISVAFPLQAGTYEICAGTTRIGDPVTVGACGGTELCSLSLPTNALLVDQGVDKDLSVTLSNVGAGGTYALTLERWEDDDHTASMTIPSSLHLPDPAEATVAADASVSFDLSAVTAETEGGQGHWANVIVKARSASCMCEAAFDLDIRNISAKASCAGYDYFIPGGTVYGKALLGLEASTSYPLHVVDSKTDWTDGMAIPGSCTHCTTSPETTITTDAAGEMACGTVLWSNAQADALPASFDIVIDVNDNGIYDVDVDFLDAGTIAGFIVDSDTDGDGVPNAGDNCWEIANANQFDSNGNCPDPPYDANPFCGDACEHLAPDSDEDGVPDISDNCPNKANPDQLDNYPPQGNNIGDACDCEGNFNCDANLGSDDVSNFISDTGRNLYNNRCTNENPCNGDFLCDGSVDSLDVSKFLEDTGRNTYNNPCPICVAGNWCSY